jgi:hypothetical protein
VLGAKDRTELEIARVVTGIEEVKDVTVSVIDGRLVAQEANGQAAQSPEFPDGEDIEAGRRAHRPKGYQ